MSVDIQKLMNTDLPGQLTRYPDQTRAIGAKYQLVVTGGGGGTWFIDASDSGPRCRAGQDSSADATITMAAEDFQKFLENPQSNGMQLFFAGKFLIQGNQMLAMKFGKLFSVGQS